ncbi:MAG: RNA methyltransferase [Rhodospirillales bacterium]
MRGYFGIGAERISKAMNVGSLFRTGHAFGASFAFTVDARYDRNEVAKADTSNAIGQLPFYRFPTLDEMMLPDGCEIVGIELTDDAVELPSFRHPPRAAYVLGPERGSLSADMLHRCAHVVKIPTRFCINVGLAGAITLYDRTISLGGFQARPVRPGGPFEAPPQHVHGGPVLRREMEAYRADPPADELQRLEDETTRR